jgi:hypothetical protein
LRSPISTWEIAADPMKNEAWKVPGNASIQPDAAALETPMMETLRRRSATSSGRRALEVLRVYLEASSLRAATARLHRHHSSVAVTVQRTLERLDVRQLDGLSRAMLLANLIALDLGDF